MRKKRTVGDAEIKSHISDYLRGKGLIEAWDDIYHGIPPKVTPEEFVECFDIDEIDYAFRHIGSEYSSGLALFIEEYAEVGDIELLAQKVLQSYGYPEDEDKLIALATLVEKGSEIIDPNKIIDALTYEAYSYKDMQSIVVVNQLFYDKLQETADEEHLAKLLE